MDDIAIQPKARISAAEMERRRKALRSADAHNRIEGVFRGPETDDLFEAAVRGDIEVTEIVPLLKARLGL
jgi:hypothetical protein